MKKHNNTINLPSINEKETKEVDKSLDELITLFIDIITIDNINGITNKKIDIKCSELIPFGYITLKKTMQYINKVNFDKPNQRKLLSIFNGIPLENDYRSPSTLLYLQLLNMKSIEETLEYILLQIEQFKEVISDQIKAVPKEEYTESLEIKEGTKKINELDNFIIKILNLKECYNTVLKNPTIISFYMFWKSYEKNNSKKHQYN